MTGHQGTNKEVPDSKSYAVKLILDQNIFLTGLFGSYKNKKFQAFY